MEATNNSRYLTGGPLLILIVGVSLATFMQILPCTSSAIFIVLVGLLPIYLEPLLLMIGPTMIEICYSSEETPAMGNMLLHLE